MIQRKQTNYNIFSTNIKQKRIWLFDATVIIMRNSYNHKLYLGANHVLLSSRNSLCDTTFKQWKFIFQVAWNMY